MSGPGHLEIGHAVIKAASGSALNNHWTKVYVPEGADRHDRVTPAIAEVCLGAGLCENPIDAMILW
jgi:hypothetical protein